MLKNTKAPALLVECCFVDNQNDYNHWNVEKCGDAIASAIAEKKIQGSGAAVPTPKPAMPTAKPNAAFDPEGWVRRLQAECNRQGFITKLLQERLNSLGYHCGVDGDYGKAPFHETYDAVMAYQKVKGLA